MTYQNSIQEYGKLTEWPCRWFSFRPCDISSGDDSCSGDFGSNVRKKIQNGQLQNVKINTTYIYNGFYISAIFYALSDTIGDLIYRKENIGHILYLLSFTGIFIYLQQTLLGIMNGLGKQEFFLELYCGLCNKNTFCDLLCSFIRNCRIYCGMVVSSICVCILDISTVIKTTGMALDFRNWIIKPGLAGAIMLVIGKYVQSFFTIFHLGHSWTLYSLSLEIL